MSYDLLLQRGNVEQDTWPPLDEAAVRAALRELGNVEDHGEEIYWQPAGLTAVFYLLGELVQLGIELHAGDEAAMRDDAALLLSRLVALAESQSALLYDPQCDDYVSQANLIQSLDCFASDH